MAKRPLITRVPDIWIRLDHDGFLERFLQGFDDELDRLHLLSKDILNSKDADGIPDNYLSLLGSLVGYRWKNYQTYDWNRKRIREAISRYSYKGTSLAIRDLAKEHGSNFCDITDMESTAMVWSRQGVVDDDNCYFMDSDFHHPGVFLLRLAESIDFEHFIDDFQYIKPAGTKWYFYIHPELQPATVSVSCYSELQIHMDLMPSGHITVWDRSYFNGITPIQSLLIPHAVDFSEKYVTWDSEEVLFDDSYDVYI